MKSFNPLRFACTLLAFAALMPAPSLAFDIKELASKGVAAAQRLKEVRQEMGGQGAQTSPPQLPQATGNFGACAQVFAYGVVPAVRDANQLGARALCFDGFAVLHSGTRKTPVYVAEVLNRQRISEARGEARTDVFFADARLPSSEKATLSDYQGSGFDRGHMAPAGDMTNPNGMAQSFSLANIVPQNAENNRKAWADIEKATRKFAARANGDVYVITGPVFSGQVQTIGAGRVWVPTHLFKLVFDASANRAWVHWLENTSAARVGQPISYAELVRRTGVEWLPGVRLND